jgi:hypothetical protein
VVWSKPAWGEFPDRGIFFEAGSTTAEPADAFMPNLAIITT